MIRTKQKEPVKRKHIRKKLKRNRIFFLNIVWLKNISSEIHSIMRTHAITHITARMFESIRSFVDILKNAGQTPNFSKTDQIFFIKRLSFLIKANIPLLESLTLIRAQTKSKKIVRMLDRIINDVGGGQCLSTSLESLHGMFNEFAIHVIIVGEMTGTLPENLEYLALEMNKRRILSRKIMAAFAYPIIVTCATCGITAFLVMYLFPKIMPVFQSLHVRLPFSTRVIIFISTFIHERGFELFGFVFLLSTAFFVIFKKSKTVRFYADATLLKIPMIRNIIREYNLAHMTRTLGLLLQSNTTLSDALPIVAKTMRNTVYATELENLCRVVDRGENMSVRLEQKPNIFPGIFTQIISIGELSGNLSHSCMYLSAFYEEQVDEFTRNISGLVEPILMIAMGVIVGFIAISIITPIYSITQNLHP